MYAKRGQATNTTRHSEICLYAIWRLQVYLCRSPTWTQSHIHLFCCLCISCLCLPLGPTQVRYDGHHALVMLCKETCLTIKVLCYVRQTGIRQAEVCRYFDATQRDGLCLVTSC
jgi:hypothetical protein